MFAKFRPLCSHSTLIIRLSWTKRSNAAAKTRNRNSLYLNLTSWSVQELNWLNCWAEQVTTSLTVHLHFEWFECSNEKITSGFRLYTVFFLRWKFHCTIKNTYRFSFRHIQTRLDRQIWIIEGKKRKTNSQESMIRWGRSKQLSGARYNLSRSNRLYTIPLSSIRHAFWL